MAGIRLGQGCVLLFGYRPAWDPNSSKPPFSPFFTPPIESTVTSTPKYEKSQDSYWSSTPCVTIHESAESLISALYKYDVAPAGIVVPVGPLELNDGDRAAALEAEGKFLGLDLTVRRSYMLVTFERVDGTAKYREDPPSPDCSPSLTADGKAGIAKLQPAAPDIGSVLYAPKITKTDAAGYMDELYNLGTHFVSQLTKGDRLIQVFAYETEQFKQLQIVFATEATQQADGSFAVTGRPAVYWEDYTTQGGLSGHVADKGYGNLVTLSRDPALQKAINAGDWASGFVPKGTPSIFAAARQYTLLNPLTKSVISAMTLAPIASLITDPLVAGPWDRAVKGGLLQKYGDQIVIPLAQQKSYDWTSIFPEDDSWTPQIVTPVINVYQQRVDLAKVKLAGAKIVAENFGLKSFTSFSQVLQATGDAPKITLPSDHITLIAQIIDMRRAAHPSPSGPVSTPVIEMSENAFNEFKVVCEDMYGALIFENPSSGKRQVALDGFLFKTAPAVDPATGRYKVGLSGVLTDPPTPEMLSNVKQSIEFSVVAGESLLQSSGPGSEDVRALERSYLTWLAGIIPAETKDADLASNRARALYLANDLATFSSDALYVPYLTYAAYTAYVESLVREASELNRTILVYQLQIADTIEHYEVMDSVEHLNGNVKQIGGVLTKYFGALAKGRAQMDGFYAEIIRQLDAQLAQTVEDMVDLTVRLEAQQAVVTEITEKFTKDYIAHSNNVIFGAVVQGVVGLFKAAAHLEMPAKAAGDAFKALEAFNKAFVQLHGVMDVLQSITDAENLATGEADKLNTLSTQIAMLSANGTLEMPSQIELLALPYNVEAALAGVPDTSTLNDDKAALVAATHTLVIIGTALLEAQIDASQILVQRGNTSRLQNVNASQQARMSALEGALHIGDTTPPELRSIDLIGVTGQLQFQLKQILLTLAQVLQLQDGALQFEYFADPTTITSFTLQNLLHVISTQNSNIIGGLHNLNPPPQRMADPITVTIRGVPLDKISGGAVFQFPIQLSEPRFDHYDMVRINRVVPRISGISSTTSGKYEVHLSCQAKPFQDRDYQRKARTYASTLRNFGPYAIDVATGVVKFGAEDDEFADKITRITPFSLWQISLPKVENNQGIQFVNLAVEVSLDFYVSAHLDDPVVRHQARARRLAAAGADTAMFAAGAPERPTLANLKSHLYENPNALNGWDAVFNVLDGPVNAFLNQQFRAYVAKLDPSNDTNLMTIEAYYCQNVVPFRHEFITTVTKMNLQLSNPLLQFNAGNNSVTVIQNVFGGTIQVGSLAVNKPGFAPDKCRLVSEEVSFIVRDPATGTLILSVNGVWENDMQVRVKSTKALPKPLAPDTDYWIVNWTDSIETTLQLSKTAGGPPITFTDAGSGKLTIYPDIEWGEPATVDASTSPYIKAFVPLGKNVKGSLQDAKDDTWTVVLDFTKGSFQPEQFLVVDWDASKQLTEFSYALKNFYAANKIIYQVQTINCSDLSGNEALTPKHFVLNTVHTQAGNYILQILIATTGCVQDFLGIGVPEPVAYDPDEPLGNRFTVSLMMSPQIMFEDVFVKSFNFAQNPKRGETKMEVATVGPDKTGIWSARVTSGSKTAPVPFAPSYEVDNSTVAFRIKGTSKRPQDPPRPSEDDNDLTWNFTGMTFDRSMNTGVALSYSEGDAATDTGGKIVDFQYSKWSPPGRIGMEHTSGGWTNWTDASATVYIAMRGNYPLVVNWTDLGKKQEVQFSATPPKIEFTHGTELQPTGSCECNDNDLQIALIKYLNDSVPPMLQEYMKGITFRSVSIFALENLLFPAAQLMTMEEAYVPAGLLVVGSFRPFVREASASHTYNVLISAATGARGNFNGIEFENGKGTGTARSENCPAEFSFKYGKIGEDLVPYTVNIEKGSIVPNTILMIVDQPNPKSNEVILLPPGFGENVA
jgi:hypothetical protein